MKFKTCITNIVNILVLKFQIKIRFVAILLKSKHADWIIKKKILRTDGKRFL